MPATKNFRFTGSCALLLVCQVGIGSAFSQSLMVAEHAEHVSVVPVATVVAERGEADNAFLLRRSELFKRFTQSTGFEACAQVCRAPDGRLGLAVHTTKAHIGCLVINLCPAGMAETGETIHSHPLDMDFQVNAADRVFMRARQAGSQVKLRARHVGEDRPVFSDTDYAGGPGYLVVGNALWHQSGEGTAVQIGKISSPAK